MFLLFFFTPNIFLPSNSMTPNVQTRGIKWGCEAIRSRRDSLEVVMNPSFNFQLRAQTIWAIPKSLWENLHQTPTARWPPAPQMSIKSTQHSGTWKGIHISGWHAWVVDVAFMRKTNGWPCIRGFSFVKIERGVWGGGGYGRFSFMFYLFSTKALQALKMYLTEKSGWIVGNTPPNHL